MIYSMKETCKLTELTYDTLKFYCNKGLIPNVKRDKNNYRIFDDNDIAWINSLSCLKNCGMTIKEMENKKKEIQESINYIHWKQGFYKDVLSGKTKYYSNLINTK